MSTNVLGTAQEKGGRSVKALTMVEAALAQAQIPREEIECIAVGLGPGSYAGIRAAISLAQGWQLARNVRVVGISSVDALAVEAQGLGVRGDVIFVIDAQRHEWYVAGYSIMEREFHEIEPLHIAPQSEVIERISRCQRVMGPDRVAGAETELLYPTAAALAKLAPGLNEEGRRQKAECGGGEKLEPIYLREAQFVKAPAVRMTNDE